MKKNQQKLTRNLNLPSRRFSISLKPVDLNKMSHQTIEPRFIAVEGAIGAGKTSLVTLLEEEYGARVILTVSVLVMGLSTVSLAWATVPIAFYMAYGAGRVLFSSSLNIGPSVVVSRWFVRRRGRAPGMLFLSHSLGMITFPFWVVG